MRTDNPELLTSPLPFDFQLNCFNQVAEGRVLYSKDSASKIGILSCPSSIKISQRVKGVRGGRGYRGSETLAPNTLWAESFYSKDSASKIGILSCASSARKNLEDSTALLPHASTVTERLKLLLPIPHGLSHWNYIRDDISVASGRYLIFCFADVAVSYGYDTCFAMWACDGFGVCFRESLVFRLHSEIDQIHLSIEAQCGTAYLPIGDCHSRYLIYQFHLSQPISNIFTQPISDIRYFWDWIYVGNQVKEAFSKDQSWSIKVHAKRRLYSVLTNRQYHCLVMQNWVFLSRGLWTYGHALCLSIAGYLRLIIITD